MKLKRVNKRHGNCCLNQLFETGKSQVSLFENCDADSPISFVRFAVSTVRQSNGKRQKVGELHIISKKKLTRETVKSVVGLFRDQVDYLFYFDPERGWEQFDSDSHRQPWDSLFSN